MDQYVGLDVALKETSIPTSIRFKGPRDAPIRAFNFASVPSFGSIKNVPAGTWAEQSR